MTENLHFLQFLRGQDKLFTRQDDDDDVVSLLQQLMRRHNAFHLHRFYYQQT